MDISISNEKNLINNTKVLCHFTNGNKYGIINNNINNVKLFINENGLISNATKNIKEFINKYYFIVKFENNYNKNINDLNFIVPKNTIIPLNLIKDKHYNMDKNINNILKVQNYLLCDINKNNINNKKELLLQNLNIKPVFKIGEKININNKKGTIIKIPKRNSVIFKNLNLNNSNRFLFNAVNFTKNFYVNNNILFYLNPIYNNKVQQNIVYNFQNKTYYYFVKIGINIHLISEKIIDKYFKSSQNNKTKKIYKKNITKTKKHRKN